MVKRPIGTILLALIGIGLLLAIYPRICSYVGMKRSLRNAEIVKEMFGEGSSLTDIKRRLGEPDEIYVHSDSIRWYYRGCGGYSVFVVADGESAPIIDIGLIVP